MLLMIANPSLKKLNDIIKKNKNLNVYRGYVYRLVNDKITDETGIEVQKFVENVLNNNKIPAVSLEGFHELDDLFFLYRLVDSKEKLMVYAESVTQAKYLRTLHRGMIFIPFENYNEEELEDLKDFEINFLVDKENVDPKTVKKLRRLGFRINCYNLLPSEVKKYKAENNVEYATVLLD